jgi:protein TonB
MLEDSLFESQGQKKTRNPVTVVVSAAAHVVTIVVLVLIPLIQTQALTVPPVDMSLWAPRIEPETPVQVFSARPRVQEQEHTRPDTNILRAPVVIPDNIIYVDEPPKPTGGFAPSTGNDRASLLVGLLNRPTEAAPPALPPALPPPPIEIVKATPIRVSVLEQANLIHRVSPVYPPIAIKTRIQGTVVLEATITKEGTIETLRIISGHPLLARAALDAVSQWRYRPLFLNGEPVEVITTVTVTFTLQ